MITTLFSVHQYTTNSPIINQIKLLEIELRLLLDSIVILEAQIGTSWVLTPGLGF